MKHDYKSFAPDLTEPSPLGLAWILRNLATEMPGFEWNYAHCKYR